MSAAAAVFWAPLLTSMMGHNVTPQVTISILTATRTPNVTQWYYICAEDMWLIFFSNYTDFKRSHVHRILI